MNRNWINRNKNSKLILFFNGWGFDTAAIMHLKTEGYDVVEFHDYGSLNFEAGEFRDYTEIYVVAWSLGVWAASYVLSTNLLDINKAIAINGTANPVHEKEGIHPTIFEGTLKGWNEKNKNRFQMRLIGGKSEFMRNASKFGTRTIEDQKAELINLYQNIQQNKELNFNFDMALIGNQDAIFSQPNQWHYWQAKANCKTMDMPHYPFLHFSSWENIINQ